MGRVDEKEVALDGLFINFSGALDIYFYDWDLVRLLYSFDFGNSRSVEVAMDITPFQELISLDSSLELFLCHEIVVA